LKNAGIRVVTRSNAFVPKGMKAFLLERMGLNPKGQLLDIPEQVLK